MNNTTTEEETLFEEESVSMGVYLFGICSLTWTIGANIFILMCFIRNRKRRWTQFSRQTCSMSVCDLFLGLSGIPFIVIEQRGRQVGMPICGTIFYMMFSFQCVTLLHVVGICIHRNIKLLTMGESVEPTSRTDNAHLIIFVSWLFALCGIAVPFVVWARKDSTPTLCYLSTVFGHYHMNATAYIGYFYLVLQGLTNGLYLFTCCRLSNAIRRIVPFVPSSDVQVISSQDTGPSTRTTNLNTQTAGIGFQNRNTLRMPGSNPRLSILRTQKQVIGTIGILLLMFNVFTLPLTATMITERERPFNPNARFIICSVFVLNSGLNPLVYATRISSLREAARKLFRDIISYALFFCL